MYITIGVNMDKITAKYEVAFEVPGTPVPKGRPKFRRAGGFVQAYTPAKTRNAEKEIVNCFKEQVKGFKMPEKGPVSLAVVFYMPIPKGTSKKRIQAILEQNTVHIKKPDLDNLVKLVQDALNEVAWEDDGCVFNINAAKCYGLEPKICISIAYL